MEIDLGSPCAIVFRKIDLHLILTFEDNISCFLDKSIYKHLDAKHLVINRCEGQKVEFIVLTVI